MPGTEGVFVLEPIPPIATKAIGSPSNVEKTLEIEDGRGDECL